MLLLEISVTPNQQPGNAPGLRSRLKQIFAQAGCCDLICQSLQNINQALPWETVLPCHKKFCQNKFRNERAVIFVLGEIYYMGEASQEFWIGPAQTTAVDSFSFSNPPFQEKSSNLRGCSLQSQWVEQVQLCLWVQPQPRSGPVPPLHNHTGDKYRLAEKVWGNGSENFQMQWCKCVRFRIKIRKDAVNSLSMRDGDAIFSISFFIQSYFQRTYFKRDINKVTWMLYSFVLTTLYHPGDEPCSKKRQ